MGLRINADVPAVQAVRALDRANAEQDRSLRHLARWVFRREVAAPVWAEIYEPAPALVRVTGGSGSVDVALGGGETGAGAAAAFNAVEAGSGVAAYFDASGVLVLSGRAGPLLSFEVLEGTFCGIAAGSPNAIVSVEVVP